MEIGIKLVGELLWRLDEAVVLKCKAKRLRSYLVVVKGELERMKSRRECAVEIEQVLYKLLYCVQQLGSKGFGPFGLLQSAIASRKQSRDIDELEQELRRLIEGYKLAQQNDMEEKLELIIARLKTEQAEDDARDMPEDVRTLKASLDDAVSDSDVGTHAVEVREIVEDMSDEEIDRSLRSSGRRNKLTRKVKQLTATITTVKEAKVSMVDPDTVEIEESVELGKGAFGQVVLGRLNRKSIAIKRCHLRQAEMYSELQRDMLREAEQWKKLKHPNIVKFLGHCIKDSSVLLLMEKCDISLHTALHESDAEFTQEQQDVIVLGIARGIDYLHTNNVLHRDIKPANVLLNHQLGKVKLTDFGLAVVKHETSSLAGTHSVRGSWPYMAPEVLEEPARWSSKADIFAFAVTCWEITERDLPWGHASPVTIATRVKAKDRLPFGEDIAWTSRMQKVVQQCWHDEASRRPSAQDIIGKMTSAGRGRRSTKIIQAFVKLVRPSVGDEDEGFAEVDEQDKRVSESRRLSLFNRSKRPSFHPGLTRVRVKRSVETPAYGWGLVTHDSIGVIKSKTSDESVTVDFPEQSGWTANVSELEVVGTGDSIKIDEVKMVSPFKVGESVRVKASVSEPKYGWGKVSHASVGTIIRFDSDGDLKVDFPEQTAWTGVPDEMERVFLTPKVGDRVKLRDPKASNSGCLANGAVGAVMEVTGSQGNARVRVRKLDGDGVETSQETWFNEGMLKVSHDSKQTTNRRLTVGDKVRLAPGITMGCLKNGLVGVIIQDDHDSQPYKVKSLDAEGKETDSTYWYRESEVVPAEMRKGDFVRFNPEMPQSGCLKEGDIGIIVQVDSSTVPYKVDKLDASGHQTGVTWWYPARKLLPATGVAETPLGPIYPNGSPHPRLAVGARVVHERGGAGKLIGFKHEGRRTGDTSGGLVSDGYVRIQFDESKLPNNPYNVSSSEVTFEATGSAKHSMRSYVEASVQCPSCHYWGPSSESYTGRHECSKCRLCENCCNKKVTCSG